MKDLDINNHYKYIHIMWPPTNHIFYELKECQRNVLKPNTQISTTTITYSKTQGLDINKYY